jgi:chromosome segregation ATPase
MREERFVSDLENERIAVIQYKESLQLEQNRSEKLQNYINEMNHEMKLTQ